MALKSREVRLKALPDGLPGEEHFELATTTVDEPADGQVLLRSHLLSVDPFLRNFMNQQLALGSSTRPAQGLLPIGRPVAGPAVSRVIASRTPELAEGDWVIGRTGWREHAVTGPGGLRRLDPDLAPVSTALGVLGMPGFSAWVGIELLAEPRPGETLYVSSAAGPVGALAGQLAQRRGARVIGSAGSAEKVAWLRTIGFAAAFDYRRWPVPEALAELAPGGLEIAFDNVGGPQLEAMFEAMNDFGRVIVCGAIAAYNTPTPAPGPSNLHLIYLRALTVRGFRNYDYGQHFDRFLAETAPLVREGAVAHHENIIEGIENTPAAFADMLSGRRFGKTLVRVD